MRKVASTPGGEIPWGYPSSLFRQVYAFFIVHMGSRKVVYAAACRNPTQEWTAQHLRNATMDGDLPKILLRDRDGKFGASFDRAAKGVGIRVIKPAVRAPDMNAVAERFVGSARREILDHVIVLDDLHLGRLVARYKEYFNEARPHQGIGQRIPGKQPAAIDITERIVAKPILGGLHHDYRRAA
jgi:putative transposase